MIPTDDDRRALGGCHHRTLAGAQPAGGRPLATREPDTAEPRCLPLTPRASFAERDGADRTRYPARSGPPAAPDDPVADGMAAGQPGFLPGDALAPADPPRTERADAGRAGEEAPLEPRSGGVTVRPTGDGDPDGADGRRPRPRDPARPRGRGAKRPPAL